MKTVDLDAPCTQQEFADMFDISQKTVSELLSRAVIQPGQTRGDWVRDYASHLRERAAGRGADNALADNRAEESFTRNELLKIKLAVERKEYAPVSTIELVLSSVGRAIVGILEPLHVNLHKLCPALTPEDLKIIQREVAKACDVAVTASLASLDVGEEDTDIPEVEDEPDVLDEAGA